MSRPFVSRQPRTEEYWRGIILFGRNVATYKFALGQALLELRPEAGELVSMEVLAAPFAKHLCAHLRLAQRQGTFQTSRLLDVCRKANAGELSQFELQEQTVRLGFNNVVDAFHVVGRDEIPQRFFVDERRSEGGIRITEAFSELVGGSQAPNLPVETDARWRLVETAWELGLSPALLAVSHDPVEEELFVIDAARRRKSITGARGALSGYQKGQCFYCFDRISVAGIELPDVDHFFPHVLKSIALGLRVDEVWNLVLACRRCNRGIAGKSDRVPGIQLLERLSTRNEFLIASHHPLRDTLIAQTGADEEERRSFLNSFHIAARAALIHEWEPTHVGEPQF